MTLPGLIIDTSAATPVYRQIAEQIRREIEAQTLAAGSRLPPIRDLTADARCCDLAVGFAFKGPAAARQGRRSRWHASGTEPTFA
jgi:DNA-binding transcriptional MocR family regulator